MKPFHERPELAAIRKATGTQVHHVVNAQEAIELLRRANVLASAKRHRECGNCTLCCRLLPVVELGKVANQRCQHQCSKGCRIYKDRPGDCWAWSCRWLLGGDVGPRPDRSHVIVDDMLPGTVALNDDATGKRTPLYALQLWVDPAYPDAHENEDVRAYLAEECDRMTALVIVRYSSSEGFVLFPPCFTPDGKWKRVESTVLPENDPRTIADREALGLSNI